MTPATIKAIQMNLKQLGHDPGKIDGKLGPRTLAAWLAQTAGRPLGDLGRQLGGALAAHGPSHGLTSILRLAHFMAQAAHETTGFRHFVELGGPNYFARYDGRRDLGNTVAGDGARYCGRGIFQLTGRANYAAFGPLVGCDLEANPTKAAEPTLSVAIACHYWTKKSLNAFADRDDVLNITKRINGGTNGLADRKQALARAKLAAGL